MPVYDPAHNPIVAETPYRRPSTARPGRPAIAPATTIDESAPEEDPARSLGSFALGARLIVATYIGRGRASLVLLAPGGAVSDPVGVITGVDTAVPLLFTQPAQRHWTSEPATAWFLTRTTVDRYRSTPNPPTHPTGAPIPARPIETHHPHATPTTRQPDATRPYAPPAAHPDRPDPHAPSGPRAPSGSRVAPTDVDSNPRPVTDPDPTPPMGSRRARNAVPPAQLDSPSPRDTRARRKGAEA